MTPNINNSRAITLGARLAIVVIATVLPFVAAHAKPQVGTPVDESLMQTLDQVSMSSLDDVVLPQDVSVQAIDGKPVDSDATPTLLYMGASYCPYCAAIRWPLVLALMRFGQFSDLQYMRSSSEHTYPSTVTFSFHGASYESDHVKFRSVEFQDRAGEPLEKPNRRQIEIFRKFNTPPYTKFAGGIPFLYLDGQYMQAGSPFNVGLLTDHSWAAIADKLKQQESPVRKALLGVTNLYTAAICKLTQGQPAKVCESKAVTAAAEKLPKSKQ